MIEEMRLQGLGVIADAVSLLNPRVVVIGGQLAHADEQLFAGIREMVYRRSLPLATRNLQIVSSRLGQRAGCIGLALLLADMIFAADRLETPTSGQSRADDPLADEAAAVRPPVPALGVRTRR